MTTQPKHSRHIFRDFLKKGRRRTDNTLIVGLIVCGISVIGLCSAISLPLLYTLNMRIGVFAKAISETQKDHSSVRGDVIAALENQARTLSRLCVMTAKTREERQACQPAPPPSPPPAAPKKGTK